MAYTYDRGEPGLTPAVKWILVANVLAFIVQIFRPNLFEWWFALWPHSERVVLMPTGTLLNQFYPWQLVTYGFLHGNFMHIAFNMFGLWIFGQSIEQALGTKRFTIYYFVCVIGAGLIQLLVAQLTGSYAYTVGASGAIFGLLMAFGLMFPRTEIMMIFLPVPIEARYFVMIYGAMELINGVTNTHSGVAHFAHLGGMVFGFFLLQYWRGKFPFGSRRSDL
jgi:membrane associated rhomboid family serine protease